MARIDDAVTRILRVKLRAGLFDHKPSDSRHAGDVAAVQHREHRVDMSEGSQRSVLFAGEEPIRPTRRVKHHFARVGSAQFDGLQVGDGELDAAIIVKPIFRKSSRN